MCLSTQLPAQTTDSGSVVVDEAWGDSSGFLLSVNRQFTASELRSALQTLRCGWFLGRPYSNGCFPALWRKRVWCSQSSRAVSFHVGYFCEAGRAYNTLVLVGEFWQLEGARVGKS